MGVSDENKDSGQPLYEIMKIALHDRHTISVARIILDRSKPEKVMDNLVGGTRIEIQFLVSDPSAYSPAGW